MVASEGRALSVMRASPKPSSAESSWETVAWSTVRCRLRGAVPGEMRSARHLGLQLLANNQPLPTDPLQLRALGEGSHLVLEALLSVHSNGALANVSETNPTEQVEPDAEWENCWSCLPDLRPCVRTTPSAPPVIN